MPRFTPRKEHSISMRRLETTLFRLGPTAFEAFAQTIADPGEVVPELVDALSRKTPRDEEQACRSASALQ